MVGVRCRFYEDEVTCAFLLQDTLGKFVARELSAYRFSPDRFTTAMMPTLLAAACARIPPLRCAAVVAHPLLRRVAAHPAGSRSQPNIGHVVCGAPLSVAPRQLPSLVWPTRLRSGCCGIEPKRVLLRMRVCVSVVP